MTTAADRGGRLLQYVGAVAFVVGLVGYAVFGWRFGQAGDSPATVVGILAAVVALAWTFLRSR